MLGGLTFIYLLTYFTAEIRRCCTRRVNVYFLACVLMIDSVMPFRASFAHEGH